MPHPESELMEEGGQVKSPVIHSSLGIRSLPAASPQDHMAISVLEEDHLPAGHPKDVLRRQNARTLEDESEHSKASRKIWTKEKSYGYIKKKIDLRKSDDLESIIRTSLSHLPGDKHRIHTIFNLFRKEFKKYCIAYEDTKIGTYSVSDQALIISSLFFSLLGAAVYSQESLAQSNYFYVLIPYGVATVASVFCITRWLYLTSKSADCCQRYSLCGKKKTTVQIPPNHEKSEKYTCFVGLILMSQNPTLLRDLKDEEVLENLIERAKYLFHKFNSVDISSLLDVLQEDTEYNIVFKKLDT